MTDLFTPDHLAQVIADTIPALHPDRTHVVVGTVDPAGVQIVASFTRSDHGVDWALQAVARQDWSGDRYVAGKVILQW